MHFIKVRKAKCQYLTIAAILTVIDSWKSHINLNILATEVELESVVITLNVNHAFITLSEPGHSIKLGITNLPKSEIMIISNVDNDAVLSETNNPLKNSA